MKTFRSVSRGKGWLRKSGTLRGLKTADRSMGRCSTKGYEDLILLGWHKEERGESVPISKSRNVTMCSRLRDQGQGWKCVDKFCKWKRSLKSYDRDKVVEEEAVDQEVAKISKRGGDIEE